MASPIEVGIVPRASHILLANTFQKIGSSKRFWYDSKPVNRDGLIIELFEKRLLKNVATVG
jgi:hypothetical protein